MIPWKGSRNGREDQTQYISRDIELNQFHRYRFIWLAMLSARTHGASPSLPLPFVHRSTDRSISHEITRFLRRSIKSCALLRGCLAMPRYENTTPAATPRCNLAGAFRNRYSREYDSLSLSLSPALFLPSPPPLRTSFQLPRRRKLCTRFPLTHTPAAFLSSYRRVCFVSTGLSPSRYSVQRRKESEKPCFSRGTAD